ncbi:MAG TPA: galactose mutarotase [Acholeplasma sp.]|nr:galactose mutarotase [Acholeplasma sp.]
MFINKKISYNQTIMDDMFKIYTIENDKHRVSFLNIGAAIYEWYVKSKKRHVVLTNANLSDYFDSTKGMLGATIGRVANRIKDGILTFDNNVYFLETNFDHGANTGHGGNNGFHTRPFVMQSIESDRITFGYVSKHMEEGFPGEVMVYVHYRLDGDALIINYEAYPDQRTPINLTNHTYFNLSGEDTILNHEIQSNVKYYLPYNDKKQIAGTKMLVMYTPYILLDKIKLADVVMQKELQIPMTNGLDHCYMFDPDRKQLLRVIGGDLELNVSTSYPAVHIYTSGFASKQALKNSDEPFNKYRGIALECQYESDAVSHKYFSDIIFGPDRPYKEEIRYEIKPVIKK